MKMLGIILVIAGVLVLGYQGFSYTQREKVVDVGPIKAYADHDKFVYLPPILGVAALLGGAALIFSDRRRV